MRIGKIFVLRNISSIETSCGKQKRLRIFDSSFCETTVPRFAFYAMYNMRVLDVFRSQDHSKKKHYSAWRWKYRYMLICMYNSTKYPKPRRRTIEEQDEADIVYWVDRKKVNFAAERVAGLG